MKIGVGEKIRLLSYSGVELDVYLRIADIAKIASGYTLAIL